MELLVLAGVVAYFFTTVILVPFAADEKGRSAFGWLVIAIFSSPLLALILAAIPSLKREHSEPAEEPSAWQRCVAGYKK